MNYPFQCLLWDFVTHRFNICQMNEKLDSGQGLATSPSYLIHKASLFGVGGKLLGPYSGETVVSEDMTHGVLMQ